MFREMLYISISMKVSNQNFTLSFMMDFLKKAGGSGVGTHGNGVPSAST